MNLARSLRLLLAVALFAAWQNALVHPLVHVDGHGGFVHLADGDAGKGNAGDPNCDAIAAIAVCVGGSTAFILSVPRGVDAFASRHADVVRGIRFPAYQSQAPPQHS